MPATTAPTPTPTCSRCGDDPSAPCHGSPGCHGYHEGCDCPECSAAWREVRRGWVDPPVSAADLAARLRGPFAADQGGE